MSRQVLTTLVWWKTRWKTYRYKICICSVILGQNLSLFEIYIRASVFNYASVNSSWAQLPPLPPGLLRGHLQILRWSTPVSYQNILHRGFYWKNKQIGSSVKDRKKLKRFVKTYSRFYACISSLLIKPELHNEIGSYRCESTFFWVVESNFCWYYLKNILS